MPGDQKNFKVITGDFIFNFDENEITDIDLFQKSATSFNCIKDHRSVNAEIITADMDEKKFTIEVEGETFAVEIKDELDQMLELMGLGSGANKKITNIKAPMPGLVLEIMVTEGQGVMAGDNILILEAMKMENSLVIPADAVIKTILVKKGQVVDRGQILIELGTP